MDKTRQIEVGGKKYTLTCRRSMIFNISKTIPECVKISQKSKSVSDSEEKESLAYDAGALIYDHIDVIFYEMIRIAHPDITKEKSDSIYDAFYKEYNDVDEHILDFFYEAFTDGIPREKKKNLDW